MDAMITEANGEGAGSSDGIFAVSEDLIQSPNHKAASTTTVDFDGLLEPPLVLHEDLANGCGGQLWPAGMRLARYLLHRQRNALRQHSMCVHPVSSSLVMDDIWPKARD